MRLLDIDRPYFIVCNIHTCTHLYFILLLHWSMYVLVSGLMQVMLTSCTVYCNSLLATLNARRTIKGDYDEDEAAMSLSLQSHSVQRMTSSVLARASRVGFWDLVLEHGFNNPLSPHQAVFQSRSILRRNVCGTRSVGTRTHLLGLADVFNDRISRRARIRGAPMLLLFEFSYTEH